MNPRPKMAKFVLTTCAACFARQKPVSTSAKPGLHEDHQDRPDDHPQHVEAAADEADRLHRVLFLGERDATGEERHERRPCQAAERVLQRTFPSHHLSLVRGPRTWTRPPGAIRAPVERVRISAAAQRCFGSVAFLRVAAALSDRATAANGAAARPRSAAVDALHRPLVQLPPEPVAEREAVDQLALDRRHPGAVHDDAGRGERRRERRQRARPVAPRDRARGVPGHGVVVELHDQVGQRLEVQRVAERLLHALGQPPRARPYRGADQERVDGRPVGPRGDGRRGDVAPGRGQRAGAPGQQGVGVERGDVDEPVVGRALGAHRHPDRAPRRQRLHQPGLAGQLVGLVGQQEAGRCGSEPGHGARARRRAPRPGGVGRRRASCRSPSTSGWASRSPRSSASWSRRSRCS